MQSSDCEPLHQVIKSKRVHSSVENFEKTLKVEQKVLRDVFGWFCSVYLPDTIDASASAIIEPYHSETKQMTIILKVEYVRPHSQFRSIIVRQKFNMSLEANESQETASVIRKISDSIENLNYYNTDELNITIHQPTSEEGKIKKTSCFLDNLTRLSDHIQRFYVKNYLNWITGDNSTLVLALSKRHGEVACFFPTHYKNFEKCIRRKFNVVVKQEKFQINFLDETKHLAEVKRHEKLFDKNQKLRKYSKLQELLTPNYLENHEKNVFEEEEFVVFSEDGSSSEEEFYVFVDNVIGTKLDSDSITEDEFIVVENKNSILEFFSDTDNDSSASEDSRTTEVDTLDYESDREDGSTVDRRSIALQIEDVVKESKEEEQVDSKPKEDREVCESVSNEESKIEDNTKDEITAEDSESKSDKMHLKSQLESGELGMMFSCDHMNFLLYVYLFDKDHGTIYHKCSRKPVIHKGKIEGFHITIRGDFKAYIAYDGTQARTNLFLEVHKELFKAKGTLLEKANFGMIRLKRRIKLKTSGSPFFANASSSKTETEDVKASPRSKKSFGDKFFSGGKKLSIPFFGKKDDKKKNSLKKNFKSEESSSDGSLQ